MLFYANSSSVFYVNQETEVDPAISDGSWAFPFVNISSTLVRNPNFSDFLLILVKTDLPYLFPDALPNNSQILIQTSM